MYQNEIAFGIEQGLKVNQSTTIFNMGPHV